MFIYLILVLVILAPASSGIHDVKYRKSMDIENNLASTSPNLNLSYKKWNNGLPTEYIWRADLALGDMNDDGWIDIIHSGPRKPIYTGIFTWENQGNGSWVEHWDNDAAFRDGGASVADVDNDGILDVSIGCHGSNNLEVHRGQGNFSYSRFPNDPKDVPGMDGGYIDTYMGDYNNDGNMDLTATTFWGGGLGTWEGDGTGNWTLKQTGLPNGANEHTYAVMFDDVNSDGDLDLVTSFGNGNDYTTGLTDRWIWLGDGNGTWTNSSRGFNRGNADGEDVATGDFNNDGNRDIVLIYNSLNTVAGVYLGNGIGNWSWSCNLNTAGIPQRCEAGDLDNDGRDDIAIMSLNLNNWTTNLEIFMGRGDGRFTKGSYSGLFDGRPYGIDLADLDHNGYLDIAMSTGRDTSGYPGGIHTVVNSRNGTAFPFAYVHYPRGGETFRAGSVRVIKWTTGRNDSNLRVDLDYTLSGTNGPFLNIARNVTDSGSYQWKVPNTPSRFCRIRVTLNGSASTKASAVSIGNFTIMSLDGYRSYINILHPKGEEIFTVGSTVPIRFYSLINASISDPEPAYIYISSTGGGGPWLPIGTVSMSGRGLFTYNWTIPADTKFSNRSYIRIEARERNIGIDIWDMTLRPFIILTDAEILSDVEIISDFDEWDVGESVTYHAVARNILDGSMNHLVDFEWSFPGDLFTLNGSIKNETIHLNATYAGSGNISVKVSFLIFEANDTVDVEVLELLDSLYVDPMHVEGDVGDRFTLRIAALNPYFKLINQQVNLTMEGGGGIAVIDNATTPDVFPIHLTAPGEAVIRVTASFRNVLLRSNISIISRPYISILSVGPEEIFAKHGDIVKLETKLYDNEQKDITGSILPSWEILDGGGFLGKGIGTTNQLYCDTIGHGNISVSVTYLNERHERTIPFFVRPVLTSIDPGEPYRVVPEGSDPFIRVRALDSNGRDISDLVNATWTLTGVGSILPGRNDMEVRYITSEVGTATVSLDVDWWGDRLKQDISLEIVHNLSRVEILPDPGQLSPGDTVDLSCRAYSVNGEEISPECTFRWSLSWDGIDSGAVLDPIILDEATLNVNDEGNGTITVAVSYTVLSYPDQNLTVSVSFDSRYPLDRLDFEPENQEVAEGSVVIVTVRALNSKGKMINDEVEHLWEYDNDPSVIIQSSDEDSISLLFVSEGDYHVSYTAVYRGRILSGESEISVISYPILDHGRIRGLNEPVRVGDTLTLEVALFDELNVELDIEPEMEWTSLHGSFDNGSGRTINYTALEAGEETVSVHVVFMGQELNLSVSFSIDNMNGGGEGDTGVNWLPFLIIILSLLIVIGVTGGIHIYLRKRKVRNPDSGEGENAAPDQEVNTGPRENTSDIFG